MESVRYTMSSASYVLNGSGCPYSAQRLMISVLQWVLFVSVFYWAENTPHSLLLATPSGAGVFVFWVRRGGTGAAARHVCHHQVYLPPWTLEKLHSSRPFSFPQFYAFQTSLSHPSELLENWADDAIVWGYQLNKARGILEINACRGMRWALLVAICFLETLEIFICYSFFFFPLQRRSYASEIAKCQIGLKHPQIWSTRGNPAMSVNFFCLSVNFPSCWLDIPGFWAHYFREGEVHFFLIHLFSRPKTQEKKRPNTF